MGLSRLKCGFYQCDTLTEICPFYMTGTNKLAVCAHESYGWIPTIFISPCLCWKKPPADLNAQM